MENEDIKKVNTEETAENEGIFASETVDEPIPSAQEENAFAEIMNGIQDLARLYGNEETERERQIRMQDELRRQKEMEAIREDIERRYSQQVEKAQSNMDSIMGTPKQNPDTAPKAIDESDRTVDFAAIRDSSANTKKHKKQKPQKAQKAKKQKKKKRVQYIDLDEKNSVYRSIYSLGDAVLKALGMIFGAILNVIAMPLTALLKIFRRITEGTKNRISNSLRNVVVDFVNFGTDLKNAGKYIKKAKTSPLSVPPILAHYLIKTVKKHTEILKTLVNTTMPILALVIMIFVFNYWHNVTIALDVIYNGNSIGYITDESVFIEAKDMVADRLSIATVNSGKGDTTVSLKNMDAGYKLAVVSLDELNDALTISDKMIENSVDNLTNACGIYIDGALICAVKNEADAKTVFHNILEPYEKQAKSEGYVVNFAENIDYVQGLYPDEPSVMWDAAKLEKHILGDGTEDGAALVNIKKTITTSKIAPVPYKIIKKRDITKYSGYRMVTQKGADGTQRVISTVTYINDVYENTAVKYETITEAVDEIVIVGTRTTYDGVYIGEASDYGFLWPAPRCHYISSGFGWRSSGWHKGLDLCTTNGAAYGSPVIASKSGVVEAVQNSNTGYGSMVLINHGDGYKTRYGHMINGSITVKVGETVEAGQTIGKVGSTGNSSGPHLHFEVIYNGDTYDPRKFLS